MEEESSQRRLAAANDGCVSRLTAACDVENRRRSQRDDVVTRVWDTCEKKINWGGPKPEGAFRDWSWNPDQCFRLDGVSADTGEAPSTVWLLQNERTVARDPCWCTWTTNWRAADAYRARHVEQRVSGHVGRKTKPASLRRRRASRSARVDARDHPAAPEQASRPALVGSPWRSLGRTGSSCK